MTKSLINEFIGSNTGFIHENRPSRGLEGRYRRASDIQFIIKLDRLMELPSDAERKAGLKKLMETMQ